jgi:hypothetical protein
MPPSRADWATAYAAQSASDFALFEMLSSMAGIPRCHLLHYLQMACEKISKAYMFRDTDAAEEKLLTQHVVFSKFINAFFGSAEMRNRYAGKQAQLQIISKVANRIAREIEKLAPAVDRLESPSNAEYPWPSNGGVIVPCSYDYPDLSSLQDAGSISFLKIVKEVIVDFDKLTIASGTGKRH